MILQVANQDYLPDSSGPTGNFKLFDAEFRFAEPESADTSPAPRVRSARSANRSAWWEQDLSRTATYLLGQARSDDERAFVEQLYDEAMAEGPDFINYRGKSAFLAAPRLGIDRNAYARILNALEAIERGTYRGVVTLPCREREGLSASGIVRPLRLRSATWPARQREARGRWVRRRGGVGR